MSSVDPKAVKGRFSARRPTAYDPELAPDSQAKRCFVNQGFSQRLQKFLINYSLQVRTPLAHTIGTR